MKYYGKSEEVAEGLIAMFRSGNLPEALAPVFVHRHDDVPCRSWSWHNQLLTAIAGTNDARGFRQWEAAGRQVKKGEHAFHVLGPCIKKMKTKDDDGNEVEVSRLYGFKSIPVFRVSQTEVVNDALWEKAGKADEVEEQRLKELPLRDVAEKWNIEISSYNGKENAALGKFKVEHLTNAATIALGVCNLSTWTHELVHVADWKLGKLVTGNGQVPSNEIVAELGGAWNYIKSYSGNDKDKAIKLCGQLLQRVCNAVALILSETQMELQLAA